MAHRKGNKIRQVKSEELARQACDLWDKYAYVPIIARFLALHDELERRHGPGGGTPYINAEKKRRNKEASRAAAVAVAQGFTPYPGPGAVSVEGAKAAGFSGVFGGVRTASAGDGYVKPYPERDLLEMVGIVREIEATVDGAGSTDVPMFVNNLKRLCRRALRNHQTVASEGKSDVRKDVPGRIP